GGLGGFRGSINAYLVEDVLIDARTKQSKGRILSEISDRPLSLVALTHVHPDHQGAAKAVCEARGVPLACHADGVEKMEGRAPVMEEAADHPLSGIVSKLWEGPPHEVARLLQEGDEVAGFRVVHAPGHSVDEVIYFRDSDRVAICGDVINTMSLLTTIPGAHEPPDAFNQDPAENRRSIRKLLELEPSLICAGHGPPMRDLRSLRELVASFER
ncbi:MAG: MBL fold metallo-hydrolase, partial [Solirubrobacterales bacterium]